MYTYTQRERERETGMYATLPRQSSTDARPGSTTHRDVAWYDTTLCIYIYIYIHRYDTT